MVKSRQKPIVTVPAGQSCKVVCDSRQTKSTGPALTGALFGEIAGYAGGLAETARSLAESHNHPHSRGGADRA